MTRSTVSLVMTAWNAEAFIEEALRSVLAQSTPPSEIIVVDDGSTDGTGELARSLDERVLVLRQDNAGIGPARTAGIARSTGDLIAFLDADDLWLPRKLERQVGVLDADPAVDAAFCLMDEFLDGGAPPPGTRPPQQGVAAILVGAALVRRSVIERLGSFASTPVGEWVGWWARARALGVREHVVPEVLFRRRIHADNNSRRNDDQGRTFLAVARSHLRATRARDGEPA
jgi:glycosyltransferase involved in cell wall biosynthesis